MAEGTIDRLSIEISGNADAAARSIRELASGLSALESSTGRGVSRLNELSRAVGALRSASSGIKLTSVANSIQKLSAAASSLPQESASRVAALASAIKPLGQLGSVNLGQLGKLPAVMREFAALDVSSISSQMRALNSSLAPLSASVERLATAYGSMPKSMRSAAVAARSVKSANENLTRATASLAAANERHHRSLAGMVSGMRASMAMFTGAWYVFKRSVGAVITEVNTYIENMNLFEASMGSYTQSATEFGNKVQEVMGIDFGEWARNQGVFMTLATGMGVTADKASVMSQQLTQLGYDIASFYNLDVQEAMLKLQSGLAGELEPLRRIGWDLSNARMNLELSKMGIEGNAQSMTQAEKVALRYKMIMEQVTITHGDMARTLASPANQIRVLKAQVTLAARAVGNLFIPALNAILPVAIGVVKAIRLVAQTIASLFGIDATFEVDYSGLDTSGIATGNDAVEETADALDDAGSAASDAARKVKEYQNTVMGFDELNKLNATPEYGDSDGGGGGSSGADAGGLGLDGIDVPTYDFLDGVNKAITELSDRIAENIVGALRKVLPIVAGIGAGFAAWKIANALLKNADKLDDGLSRASRSAARLSGELSKAGRVRLAGVTAGLSDKLSAARLQLGGIIQAPKQFLTAALPWAAAVGLVVGHFANLAANSENFRRGLGAVRDAIESLPSPAEAVRAALDAVSGVLEGIWDVASKVPGAIADWVRNLPDTGIIGAVKAAFQAVADAVGAVAGGLHDLLEESGLLDAARGTVEQYAWAFGALGDTVGWLATDVFDLKLTDAVMGAGAALALLSGHPAIAALILAFEGVSLAMRGIGYATSPVIESVDELAGVSDETAAAFGTSLDSMEGAMRDIDRLDFGGMVVSEEDVKGVGEKVQDIHDTLVNNLDARHNEELMNIEALRGFLTDEEVEKAKQAAERLWGEQRRQVDEGTARITEIMQASYAENRGLTQAESDEINRILADQYDRLVATSGASSEEIASINKAMHENDKAAALEAASAVIKSAREEKDGAIEAATEKHRSLLALAENMRANGDITEEEYNRMVAAAQAGHVAEVNEAKAKYDGILAETEKGLGEDLLPYIDTQTGDIKSKWDVAYEGVSATAADAYSSVKMDSYDARLSQDKDWDTAAQWFAENVADPIAAAYRGAFGQVKGDSVDARVSVDGDWSDEAEWFRNNVADPVWKAFNGAFGGVRGDAVDSRVAVQGDWSAVSNWFRQNVSDPVSRAFSETFGSVTGDGIGSRTALQGDWSGVGSWFRTSVADPIGSALGSAWDSVSTGARDAWRSVCDTFGRVGEFFSDTFGEAWSRVASIFSPGSFSFQSFADSIYGAFRSIANDVIWGINDVISVPFGAISSTIESMRTWEVFGERIFSWLPTISIPQIPYLAEGRYGIASGQLFVARERGPEMVGRIGSKTTVANNDQIVEGIEAGVLRAMAQAAPMFAQRQEGGDVTLVLQVDGQELARVTERGRAEAARRGQLSTELFIA